MPVYAASSSKFLSENQSYAVWGAGTAANADSIAANAASKAVQLERRKSNNQYPWGFAVQVERIDWFTVDIEVQGAETDVDAAYVKLASITSINASGYGRGDYVAYWPKYVRLFARTLSGTQAVQGIITR
jgi:hypothetical protein